MRLSRLAKKRKKLTKVKYVVLAVFLVLFVVGLSYGSKAKALTISSVNIVGNKSTTAAEINALIDKDTEGTYWKLFSKKNVVLYPKGAIENSVIKAIPRIQSVKINVDGLTKATLTVTEREPVALWCATICYLLDKNGFVFAPAPDYSDSLFVRYRGGLDETKVLGAQFLSPVRFEALHTFEKNASLFGLEPLEIVVQNDNEMEMKLKGGGTIIFDDSNDLNKSFDNLEVIVLQQKSGLTKQAFILNLDYIDLRFGNKIFYKIIKEKQETME